MSRKRTVNWPNKTEEVKEQLKLHSPENYRQVIIQNYYLYGSRARRDIAEVLYDKLMDTRKKQPEAIAAQQNLFLEIYSKYLQVIEELALLGMMFLYQSPTRQAFEIYMESNNEAIVGFYKMAHQGFSDDQIKKIIAIDKLHHYINSNSKLTKEEKANYQYIIDETIKIERDNLKLLGNIYTEQVISDGGKTALQQGGPVDVYNAVKHGIKNAYPTKLGKQLWKGVNDNTINLMHQVVLDESSGQKFISVGGFDNFDDNLIDAIMHNIRLFAEQNFFICEMWLFTQKSPLLVIKKLRLATTKEKIETGQAVGVNEPCLCGSGAKYKKCCKWFEYEFSKTDIAKLLDLF